jgi:hypothetical protein
MINEGSVPIEIASAGKIILHFPVCPSLIEVQWCAIDFRGVHPLKLSLQNGVMTMSKNSPKI